MDSRNASFERGIVYEPGSCAGFDRRDAVIRRRVRVSRPRIENENDCRVSRFPQPPARDLAARCEMNHSLRTTIGP
jgi:hypothetical protein